MLISILTVLSILTAVSSLTVVYPKVVPTVVFIPTVVYILTVVSSLSDYSPQHSPHSYFHVIFISAYPAVCVQFYAYVEQTNLLFAGKESSLQACDHRYNNTKGRNHRYIYEETNTGTKNDSFGKGFDVLKDHVLNRLMTGRCQSK